MPKKSFLLFCRYLRGHEIINRRGDIVPKYIVYWKNIQPMRLLQNKETNYKLIERQ